MKGKGHSCKVNYALLAIAYLEVRCWPPSNPRIGRARLCGTPDPGPRGDLCVFIVSSSVAAFARDAPDRDILRGLQVLIWTTCLLSSCATTSPLSEDTGYILRETVRTFLTANSCQSRVPLEPPAQCTRRPN